MGTSTDGQINYGILFEEYFQFPWDEEYDGNIEEWWMYKVHGYKNPFELFDEDGNYLNGVKSTPEQDEIYYGARRKFREDHPVPIELINVCSGDCPIYLLAVPSCSLSNSRGCPVEFKPDILKVSQEEHDKLIQFCKDHDIEFLGGPKWYLSSYWG